MNSSINFPFPCKSGSLCIVQLPNNTKWRFIPPFKNHHLNELSEVLQNQRLQSNLLAPTDLYKNVYLAPHEMQRCATDLYFYSESHSFYLTGTNASKICYSSELLLNMIVFLAESTVLSLFVLVCKHSGTVSLEHYYRM